MPKTINSLEARRNLGQLLEEVFYKGEQFVIQKAGKPMAVIISPSEYEAYRKRREKDMSALDEIRKKNKEAKVEEVERDVKEAIRAVRTGNA